MKFIIISSLLLNILFLAWLVKKMTTPEPGVLRKTLVNQWETTHYRLERDKILGSLYGSENRVVMLGDSHIQYYEWAEVFKDHRIKNRGIGGDNIQGVINRVNKSIDSSTKLVVIQVGINDIAAGKTATYVKNMMTELILKIRQRNTSTKIAINSLFPTKISMVPSMEKLAPHVIETNNQLMNLADSLDVLYLNVFTKLGSDQGLIKEYDSGDKLHLSAEGYHVWVNELNSIILTELN